MKKIMFVALVTTCVMFTSCSEKEQFSNIPSGEENGYDYVDLGLSVKWATCNIGAKNPEDGGFYFAWGETTPNISYVWDSYSFYDKPNHSFTKYYDNQLAQLELKDDAASSNMGGEWRMPTKEEFKELEDRCKWTKAVVNGVNGYKVTSNNGNSIFLPSTGFKGKEPFQLLSPNGGYYWTSTLDIEHPHKAIASVFGPHTSDYYVDKNYRYYGYAIRPVCP